MKLNEKELNDVVAKATEAILKDKGLDQVIRKIQFSEKKIEDMTKEEKTMRYFKALYENDRAGVVKYGYTAKDIEGTTTASGLLPLEFHADIIDKIVADPMALRSKCTVVPVQYRNGTWPVSGDAITLTWESSEIGQIGGGTQTPATPFADNLTYSVHRLDGFTKISRDLLSDTPVALYNYLATQYAKAFVKAENRAIISGTGVKQPSGILLTYGTTGFVQKVAAADTTTFVLSSDDVIGLPYNVNPAWRANGVYIVNSNAMKQIRLMKDSNKRYLFAYGDPTTNQPARINGYPVYEFDDTLIPTATNNNKIIFGDLSKYYLFDKGEMGSEINTQSDTAFMNHEALMKMWERIDGKVAINDAFYVLDGFKAV